MMMSTSFFRSILDIIKKKVVAMYTKILPDKLKEARKMTGFTQEETSKETGIKRAMISSYELGNAVPSVEKLGKLAEFYGVSVDWLLGMGKKNPNSNEEITATRQTKKVIYG